MEKGITILLSGPGTAEAVKALALRLVELGRRVEVLDESHGPRMGGAKGIACACGLLSRNGVVVYLGDATPTGPLGPGGILAFVCAGSASQKSAGL